MTTSTSFSHKEMAVKCFNTVWKLLDEKERTKEQDEEMTHLCHSSFWHWTQVEDHTPVNLSIGYWQLARVYTTVGQGEHALYFAHKCLNVSLEYRIAPFYIGYAYEGLARANAFLGRTELSRDQLAKGFDYAEQVRNESARDLLINDLATIMVD